MSNYSSTDLAKKSRISILKMIYRSQSSHIGSVIPETAEVSPVITEITAINGVVSTVCLPSSASPVSNQEQEIISPLPTAHLIVPDTDEKNIQDNNSITEETEISGDKNL